MNKNDNIFDLYTGRGQSPSATEKVEYQAYALNREGQAFGILFYLPDGTRLTLPYHQLIQAVGQSPYQRLILHYQTGVMRIEGASLFMLLESITAGQITALGCYTEGEFTSPPDGQPIIHDMTVHSLEEAKAQGWM